MTRVAGLGVAPSLEDYEPSVQLYTTPRPFIDTTHYSLNLFRGQRFVEWDFSQEKLLKLMEESNF